MSLAKTSLEQANLSKTLPEMAIALWNEKTGWRDLGIVPEDSLKLKAEDAAIRFSRTLFDAFTARNGRIFRPRGHFERLCYGADKLRMPKPNWEIFIEGVKKLANIYASNLEEGKALYLCPLLMNISRGSWKASEQSDYALAIKCCYTKPSRDTVYKIYIDMDHTRAHPEYGDIKASANYGLVLPLQYLAEEYDCNSILFTHDYDGFRCLEELATSNFFFVNKGKICTPSARRKNLLKGMTRDTIIKIGILEKTLSPIREGEYDLPIFIDEIQNKNTTEAFMTGTAITAGRITSFYLNGLWYELPNVPKEESVFDRIYDDLQSVYRGEKYPEFTMSYK